MKVKLYQLTKSKKVVLRDKNNPHIHYHSKTLSNRQHLFVSDATNIDDVAVIEGCGFKEIFGTRDGDYKKGLRIIKITFGKNSIYRQYHCSGDIHGIRHFVGLSFNSIRELCESADSINKLDEVEISKGSVIFYYLTHFSFDLKASFFIGLLGIVVSIILYMLS